MATADQRLYFLTIHQAGELMRRGELSPVELTRACLDRIRRHRRSAALFHPAV